MKKISVIIPCYNVEQYIDRCINSLLKQTIGLESLEIIFVNDGNWLRVNNKPCKCQK